MPQRIPPGRRMEQEIFDGMAASADPLGEAARRGAQLILQRTLEMEVEDFLGRGHRRQIRTTNLLERLFGEGRRRTKVIPRLR